MRRWTTADRRPGEQYAYWREVVCEAFTPLRPAERGQRDTWHRPGLPGWVTSRAFGDANGAELATCEQTIHHGPREVSRVSDEVLFVNLMVRGRCVVRQDGVTSLSAAGSFSIVDATRPFSLDYLDPWRAISFRVPKASLREPFADALTARSFSARDGVGAIVADIMRNAWSAAEELDDEQACSVGDALTTVIHALGERPPAAAEVGGSAARQRRRIEHYVARVLRTGETSPASVAAQFGISVRTLHKLYEGSPSTFANTVMRIRVEQCAQDLASRTDGLTLTKLATRWGFSDLSHLNRVSRRHFGLSIAHYAETMRRDDR